MSMARERFAAPALPVFFAFWTLLAVQACMAASQELPATAPVPVGSPIAREDPAEKPIAPDSAPLPQPRPDAGQAPEVGPQPIAKPTDTKPTDAETKPAKLIHAMTRFEKDDRIARGETQADRDCRADLGKLDADFEVHPPLLDAVECNVVNPVTLKSLGKTIRLTPAAVMNCEMARATVRFMQDVAAPAAKAEFGSDLAAVNHASAYVCRARNGNAKVSEHALGNAFDIASFVLANGTQVDVKAGAEEKQAAFLDAIRKAACGPFKTVLGPGSDADHALHFHFDLARRRSGSTFCQ